MGIIKNKILKFFLTLKYLMFFMAFVYFFVWGVQFYSIALFKKLNNIFGFLPDFFNGLISISININDKIIPLSYVFSALLMALFALLFLIIAIFMRVFQFSMLTKYLQDTEKKSIGKKLLVSSAFLVFFALLSLILVQVSAVFYENPEFDSFEWQLPLENDAGAILYYIGIVLFVLFNIFNSLILKQYMDGKVAIEKLTFIRKRDEGIRKESETTVQEQLSEWKKLLDEGVITQEEYDRKKTELLNKS